VESRRGNKPVNKPVPHDLQSMPQIGDEKALAI
jgi:hypothetical protein